MQNLEHIERFRAEDVPVRLPEILDRVAEHYDRIIVEHSGQRVAVVSIEDLEYLEHADRVMDAQDLAELAKQTPEDRKTIPWEQFLRESDEEEAAEAHDRP